MFWKGRSRKKATETGENINISPKKTLKKSKPTVTNHKRPQQMFLNINSREDLITFLINNPNKYNSFILQKFNFLKENPFPLTIVTENHHIIPKHAGGSNESWNIIKLTVTDHIRAHELRAEIYNEIGDHLTTRFKNTKGLSPEQAQQLLKPYQSIS